VPSLEFCSKYKVLECLLSVAVRAEGQGVSEGEPGTSRLRAGFSSAQGWRICLVLSNLQIAFDLVPRVHPVLRGGGEAVLLAEEEEGLGVGVAVAVGEAVGVGEEGLEAAGKDALRG